MRLPQVGTTGEFYLGMRILVLVWGRFCDFGVFYGLGFFWSKSVNHISPGIRTLFLRCVETVSKKHAFNFEK